MHNRLIPIILASLVLAACGQTGQTLPDHGAAVASRARPTPRATTPQSPAPPAGMKRFTSARLAFYIDYPATMACRSDFDSRYLLNGGWKVYASADSLGEPVLMLTLPGSNRVTAGELRIGVSSGAGEIRQCGQPPGAAEASSRGTAHINDIAFVTWQAGDAAMSHYLKARSYRVVHGGYCYAIDLLVTGTNPEVYNPPKTPPFTQNDAFARLQKLLRGFHFNR